MNRILVWDLPVRVFHWLLTAGFVVAIAIALLLGAHHALFPYHGIIGLVLAEMVALRLVWGAVGTRYARFRSFLFSPGAVLRYMKHAFTGGGERHVGHNPGSACAIFVIFALILGLAVTGLLLSLGNEGAKEVHELLAYAMIGVAVTHVLGVVLHTFRHKENITLSMIDGRKHAEPAAGIRSAQPLVALVFLALIGVWALTLLRDYEPANRTTRVPLLGTSLQLGEAENERGHKPSRDRGHEHDDD